MGDDSESFPEIIAKLQCNNSAELGFIQEELETCRESSDDFSAELRDLASAAVENSSVSTLRLEVNDRGEGELLSVWKALGGLGGLKTLAIFLCVEDEERLYFPGIVAVIEAARGLTSLQLSDSGGEAGQWSEEDLEMLTSALRNHSTLETLILNEFRECDVSPILSVLPSIKTLRTVRLDPDENAWEDQVRYVARSTQCLFDTNITTLSLSFLEFEHKDALDAFSRALGANTTIRTLRLHTCRAFHNDASQLARTLSTHGSLKELELDGWEVESGSSFFTTFAEGLGSTSQLTHLRIKDISSEQAGNMSSITSALGSDSSLTHLDVHVQGATLPHGFYQPFPSALACLESLTLVTSHMPKEGCLAIAEGVRNSVTMRSLDIGAGVDGDDGQLEIIKAVRDSGVQSVVFGEFLGLSHENQIAAVEALQGNTRLKTLKMKKRSGEPMGGVDRARFVAALRKLYGLTELTSNCGSPDVQVLLRLNKVGRKYMMKGNSQRIGLEVLGQTSDDVNCLYTHLLENPTVLQNGEKSASNKRKWTDTADS